METQHLVVKSNRCRICDKEIVGCHQMLEKYLTNEHWLLAQWGPFPMGKYRRLPERNPGEIEENSGDSLKADEQMKDYIMIPVAKKDYSFINNAAESLRINRDHDRAVEIRAERERLIRKHNISQ